MDIPAEDLDNPELDLADVAASILQICPKLKHLTKSGPEIDEEGWLMSAFLEALGENTLESFRFLH